MTRFCLQPNPNRTPAAPDDLADADDPLSAAIQRWAQTTDLRIEPHPLLDPAIAQGLHEFARGPAVPDQTRALLIAEGDPLQQLSPAEGGPAPLAPLPVSVTMPRTVALAIVGVLQRVAVIPEYGPGPIHHRDRRALDLPQSAPDRRVRSVHPSTRHVHPV